MSSDNRSNTILASLRGKEVVPIEISQSSSRVEAYEPEKNEEVQRQVLDLIDEVRNEAQARIIKYQKKASFYYNLRVKERFYRERDLVLKKIEAFGFGKKRKASFQLERSISIQEGHGTIIYIGED